MNMISKLRQRVRKFERAEITAAEYDKLQAEWIMRTGLDSSIQYDVVREAFVRNLEQKLASRDAEIATLREELETERIRLAACGVVALANTPESAAKAREMLPKYRSASCDDVARRVDSEITLREQVKMLRDLLALGQPKP